MNHKETKSVTKEFIFMTISIWYVLCHLIMEFSIWEIQWRRNRCYKQLCSNSQCLYGRSNNKSSNTPNVGSGRQFAVNFSYEMQPHMEEARHIRSMHKAQLQHQFVVQSITREHRQRTFNTDLMSISLCTILENDKLA